MVVVVAANAQVKQPKKPNILRMALDTARDCSPLCSIKI